MAIDLTQLGAPGANGLSILSDPIDPPADAGVVGELWLNYATSVYFKKFLIEGWRPILHLKGQRGDRGRNGAHTVSATINGDGDLILTQSNGTQINAGGGISGPEGQNAWSPVVGVTVDGTRRVLTITSWIGGQGTPPSATPIYVGPSGLTNVLADGVDVRGAAGAGNGDVVGPTTANIGTIAVFGDTAGDTIREPTAGELTALKNSLGIVTPPAPGLVLLGVATASNSAFLQFTGLSTYKSYFVVGRNIRPSIDSDHFAVRFSTNNGTSFIASGYQWSRMVMLGSGTLNTTKASGSPDTDFGSIASGVGSGIGQGVDFDAWISDLTQGARPKGVSSTFTAFNASNELGAGSYFASHATSGVAVNALRFMFRGGLIQSGTVALYGARPTP